MSEFVNEKKEFIGFERNVLKHGSDMQKTLDPIRESSVTNVEFKGKQIEQFMSVAKENQIEESKFEGHTTLLNSFSSGNKLSFFNTIEEDKDDLAEAQNVLCKIFVNEKEIIMVNPYIQTKSVTEEHTNLLLKGIIHQESYEYLLDIGTLSELRVCYGPKDRILFWGTVTYFDLRVGKAEEKEFKELSLEAKSFSFFMDRQLMQRAFPDKQTLYTDLINLLLSDYDAANYLISPDVINNQTNRFIVQYQETDWEFLKRLASQLHIPIVASHITYGPKFKVGVLWKTDAYELSEKEEWKVEIIHATSVCDVNGFQREQRSLRWCVDAVTMSPFEIGDCVAYKDELYYVKEADTVLQDYVFTHQYILCSKSGFEVAEKQNARLRGLSLPGSVAEVKGNQIRTHLDIDVMENADCWFTYATFYATFYCMPEVDDRIYMYFPNADDRSAYILNSVRTAPGVNETGDAEATFMNYENGKALGSSGELLGGNSSNLVDEELALNIAPYMGEIIDQDDRTLDDMTISFEDYTPAASVQSAPNSYGGGGGGGGGQSYTPPAEEQGNPSGVEDFDALAIDENSKVLSTPDGKRVVLDDSAGVAQIVLDDDTYISLQGDGIVIKTSKAIFFKADGDITMDAGLNLALNGKEGVIINCADSVIALDPDKVAMSATDIKINK